MYNDNLVLSYHDAFVRQSDLETLKPKQWINDTIIHFSQEYFIHEKYESQVASIDLYSPSVTQLIKLGSYQLPCLGDLIKIACFPINDNVSATDIGGTHWSLLVYINVGTKVFVHFDPIELHNRHSAVSIVSKLQWPHARIHEGNCERQSNSYDCGILVIKLMEHILENMESYLNDPLTIISKNANSTSYRNYLFQTIGSLA